jgi:hypothetical protein
VGGDPLLDVDGQSVAVVDRAEAVLFGEELRVAPPLLKGAFAVLGLAEGEVAVDDFGVAQPTRPVSEGRGGGRGGVRRRAAGRQACG